MVIDLVGIHYVQKIHYFGRKIGNARNALAIVGGKVFYMHELYAQLMANRRLQLDGLHGEGIVGVPDAFIIQNLFGTRHLIPFIPRDIRCIRLVVVILDYLVSFS